MARDGDIKDKSIRCSFCGKQQNDVKSLIAGPGVYICDQCIELCQGIIEDMDEEKTSESELDFTSLIEDDGDEEAELMRERRLQLALLDIKRKYGKNSIIRGLNLEEGATGIDRNNQIGGHKS